MKSSLYLLLILFVTISCNTESKNLEEERWDEVKKSSEFYLIAQFLQKYPNTKYFEDAIRLLEKPELYEIPPPPSHCGNECAEIVINEFGEVFFSGQIIDLENLYDSAMFQIYYGKQQFKRSPKTIIDLNGLEQHYLNARFEIIYSSNSRYMKIIQHCIIKISKAVSDYKKQLSIEWYKSKYKDLSSDKASQLDSLFNNRIWFMNEVFLPPPPTQPTFETQIVDTVELEN
tara:strand:+ start:24 stop:713 length:690 start_codon:yes stop_codon:yes gene_type:complete